MAFSSTYGYLFADTTNRTKTSPAIDLSLRLSQLRNLLMTTLMPTLQKNYSRRRSVRLQVGKEVARRFGK